MAEEQDAAMQEGTQPQGGEPDYKALYEKTLAESRKWEARSKANYEKAKAYDEAQQAAKTVEERVSALEAENARLTAEKERVELVKRVSEATKVSHAIVASLAGQDEETLTAQALAIAEAYRQPAGAPYAPEAGSFPGSVSPKKTTAQLFAADVNRK